MPTRRHGRKDIIHVADPSIPPLEVAAILRELDKGVEEYSVAKTDRAQAEDALKTARQRLESALERLRAACLGEE